ncbi:flagellar associated protein [Monoraphidium neglectum]|uniref:Flagellar associated protein n=1 Tax=Monoraphidium neglectum TaxID=145388 RepID=A0A0D2NCA4_9CHLO|nr:flagellar associated protein [Monoraphidium neglectum]KIZ03041.1 flagellar associated protein [Monoraphidium neglectum]|eukprot:XP_013902060.1 flagellar associated protein [Monoraphidium neglectum]
MGRDVDRLDPMPDGKLYEQDQAYLEQHGVGPLFSGLLADIARTMPADPVQFMIDSLTLGPEQAEQSPETGLPKHRQSKLEKVFRIIDKAGTGRMSLRALQAYANSHGGDTLTNADLKTIFKDFKPGQDHLVGLPQFLAFFSRVSRTINNKDFEEMIVEMSA